MNPSSLFQYTRECEMRTLACTSGSEGCWSPIELEVSVAIERGGTTPVLYRVCHKLIIVNK